MFSRRILIFSLLLLAVLTWSSEAFSDETLGQAKSGGAVFVNSAPGPDYVPALEKEDGYYRYTFYDHILISSNDDTSRCIVLQGLPFSGYYKVEVLAAYTADDSPYQRQEEYRLVIKSGGTTVAGDVMPDQHNGSLANGDKYVWKWNQHGFDYFPKGGKFHYLKKDDVKLYFVKGNQPADPGRVNSIDFRGIRLVPPPHIIAPDHEFSQGTADTIQWIPASGDAYFQDIMWFDFAQQSARNRSNPSLRKSAVNQLSEYIIDGLLDGHKYGYFAEAITEGGEAIQTQVIESTLDATPPGTVTINSLNAYANQTVSLYWNGVADAVSGVQAYQVVRLYPTRSDLPEETVATIPIDLLCGQAGKEDYCYTDAPTATADNLAYRIDAVDNVGNKSTGVETTWLSAIPAPPLTIQPAPRFESYYQGSRVTVAASFAHPKLSFAPENFQVRFQAARDSIKILNDQWQPKKYFFASDWLALKNNREKSITYTFDLTDNGNVSNSFIDGHRYYIRAQFRDLSGNAGEWSSPDTLWVKPDCFAPADMTFLTASPATNADTTDGWIKVKWGGARDATSGIDSFIVYRKIKNVDAEFKQVAALPAGVSEFNDPFAGIDYDGDVFYRIGSQDRVGNKRGVKAGQDTTKFCAAGRSYCAYDWAFVDTDWDTVNNDIRYYVKINQVYIKVDFSRCDSSFNRNIIAKVDSLQQVPRRVVDSDEYVVMLPDKKYGEYTICIRNQFADRSTSVWSAPKTVQYVDALPAHRDIKVLPNEKAIAANFPNPFNMSTRISYYIEKESQVSVDIYNVRGQIIKSLANETQNKGWHDLTWNGDNKDGIDVPSGIYYFRLHIEGAGNQVVDQVQKMLLVK